MPFVDDFIKYGHFAVAVGWELQLRRCYKGVGVVKLQSGSSCGNTSVDSGILRPG